MVAPTTAAAIPVEEVTTLLSTVISWGSGTPHTQGALVAVLLAAAELVSTNRHATRHRTR